MNRKVVPVQRCCSWPGTSLGLCEHVYCHGEAATICPATSFVSYRALSEETLQDLFIDFLTDCLPLWQELTVNHASHMKEWISCYFSERHRM